MKLVVDSRCEVEAVGGLGIRKRSGLWGVSNRGEGVLAAVSSGWGAKDRFKDQKRAAVRSAMVSVTAQRYLGKSTHPMGRTRGKATRGARCRIRGVCKQ